MSEHFASRFVLKDEVWQEKLALVERQRDEANFLRIQAESDLLILRREADRAARWLEERQVPRRYAVAILRAALAAASTGKGQDG